MNSGNVNSLTTSTLPPIVPADATIQPINSQPIIPPTAIIVPPPNVNSSSLRGSRPLTYVAFGRMRHFMRDEVKKSEATLQFRKESVHAMKDICDQFLHELMRVTIDVCTQREAAQRQAGLQVGSRTSSIRSFAQTSKPFRTAGTVGTVGTGGKRPLDEDSINEPNKRINTFRPISKSNSFPSSSSSSSSSSSIVDTSSSSLYQVPPIPPANINNIHNVNNNNNVNITAENNVPPKRSRVHQPNEESTAKARKVISDLIEKTQRKLHTVLPEDIEQALRILNLDHLLFSDPRSKDPPNEDVEEVNELFLL